MSKKPKRYVRVAIYGKHAEVSNDVEFGISDLVDAGTLVQDKARRVEGSLNLAVSHPDGGLIIDEAVPFVIYPGGWFRARFNLNNAPGLKSLYAENMKAAHAGGGVLADVQVVNWWYVVQSSDLKIQEPSQEDGHLSLACVLSTQLALQIKMGQAVLYPPDELAGRDQLLALIVEATEALAETNWKPWKQAPHLMKEVDREKLGTELTDILQFWANTCLAYGFTAAELEGYLRAKWRENHRRTDSGETTNGGT